MHIPCHSQGRIEPKNTFFKPRLASKNETPWIRPKAIHGMNAHPSPDKGKMMQGYR